MAQNKALITYAKTVNAMRKAQAQYFKRRDNFDECQRLEREVDALTDQILHPRLFQDSAKGLSGGDE